MKLKSIAIQGFRSFRRDIIFKFPLKSGLFMLTGINRKNPELGPNAVGKSSFWDALCWVLYGKTTRGLRGPDVENWSGDHLTTVLVELEQGEKLYGITRTHNPNSLTLAIDGGDPEIVEQARIDNLLRMPYEAFLAVVLMGQFNRFFFDLSATEKLDVFSKALNLEGWIKAADKAKETAKEADEELRELESQVAGLRGSIGALKEEREGLKEKSAKFLLEQEQALKQAGGEVKELERDRNKWTKLVKNDEEVLGNLDAEKVAAFLAHRAAEKIVEGLDRMLKDKRTTRFRIEMDIQAFKKKVKEAKELVGVCPCCRRPITPKCQQAAIDEARAQKEFSDAELAHLDQAIAKEEGDREEAKRKWVKADKAKETIERQFLNQERAVQESRQKLATAQAKLEQKYLQLAFHKKAEDPYLPQLESIRGKIKAQRKERDYGVALIDNANDRKAKAARWTGLFKEVRLWVIEEALHHLAIEVNNSLAQLGLEGWEITFDVERETKSGSVSRGFTVNITSPDSGKPVRWEVWCGGETQRLRIAGAIGLSTLIRNRLGINVNFEVWDEPTAHISDTGIDDLMNFFSLRAKSERRGIWMVDHHSLDHGGIDETFVVVRDDRGSRILKRRVDEKPSTNEST